VFYGDKAIDRSPCGTGTSARMAQLVALGKLEIGQAFVHESIIGSLFKGRVEKAAKVGNYAAIIPSIEGWARTTGYNTISSTIAIPTSTVSNDLERVGALVLDRAGLNP
jgi:4-hydroxyproline epimerase